MTHGALEDCADQDRDQSAKPILGQTKGHLDHTQEVHFGEEVSGSDSMAQQPSVSSRGLAAIETRILPDAMMSPSMHGSHQVSALQATQDLIRSGTYERTERRQLDKDLHRRIVGVERTVVP
jgi:hypothetical protein